MTRTALLCSMVVFATACATIPVPTDQLAAADAALQQADASRAGEPSSNALRSARGKLAAARAAVERRELLLATRLAEQARLGAELASAQSEAQRAQFAVESLRKGNEALEQQGLRDSVNAAPIAIPPTEPIESPYPLPASDNPLVPANQ